MRIQVKIEGLSQLRGELADAVAQDIRDQWATFVERMRGQPVPVIRAALVDEWQGSGWTDDDIGAIARGDEVPLEVDLGV